MPTLKEFLEQTEKEFEKEFPKIYIKSDVTENTKIEVILERIDTEMKNFTRQAIISACKQMQEGCSVDNKIRCGKCDSGSKQLEHTFLCKYISKIKEKQNNYLGDL